MKRTTLLEPFSLGYGVVLRNSIVMVPVTKVRLSKVARVQALTGARR